MLNTQKRASLLKRGAGALFTLKGGKHLQELLKRGVKAGFVVGRRRNAEEEGEKGN